MTESSIDADQAPSAAASGMLAHAARAAQEGAADAREAAARTWAATSLFTSRLVYTACYTVSYGVVFPAMMLAHVVPRDNAAVRGLMDGAHAAIEKAQQSQGALLGALSGDEPAEPALAPA